MGATLAPMPICDNGGIRHNHDLSFQRKELRSACSSRTHDRTVVCLCRFLELFYLWQRWSTA